MLGDARNLLAPAVARTVLGQAMKTAGKVSIEAFGTDVLTPSGSLYYSRSKTLVTYLAFVS